MLVVASLALTISLSNGTTTAASIAAAQCTSVVGPGMPPPADVPAGLPGFHAAWYGQSGYPTLCPGERASAIVAFYNSGSRGWVAAEMGEAAYLGTHGMDPGDSARPMLGGDGTNGSPNTGWPRADRIAAQPAAYVGPGQVAWFAFTIEAPMTPGTYRLDLRPLIEGAEWMEDYGVYWMVTVRDPSAMPMPSMSPMHSPTSSMSPMHSYSPMPSMSPMHSHSAMPSMGGMH